LFVALEDPGRHGLEGRIGALLGDEVLLGNPGDLIFKPRNKSVRANRFSLELNS